MLGVHATSFGDLELIRTELASKHLVNLIEVKPDKFTGNDRLFDHKDGIFVANHENFERLAKISRSMGCAVQFHFPFIYNDPLNGQDIGVNPGRAEDHRTIMSLFDALILMKLIYKFSDVVTFHPGSLTSSLLRSGLNAEDAIINTNCFLSELQERLRLRWPDQKLRLGIENMPRTDRDPNFDFIAYDTERFSSIMDGIKKWAGITIDSGHLNLSPDMSFKDLLNFTYMDKRKIFNFHIHGNYGPEKGTLADDMHLLPSIMNTPHLSDIGKIARFARVPMIMEVDLWAYPIDDLKLALSRIRWNYNKERH